MVFVLSSVAVEFGYHPLKCLYSLCSCYVCISQKYLKINSLGQFLSSLEKEIACFSHRVLLLFVHHFLCLCVGKNLSRESSTGKKALNFVLKLMKLCVAIAHVGVILT